MNLKKRTFQTEDARKDELFEAWNAFLAEPTDQPDSESVVEFYEGLAQVSDLSDEHIRFKLEDGRKTCRIQISAQISKRSCWKDHFYLVLARNKDQWWLVDVISIASEIRGRKAGIHFSMNPLCLSPAETSQTIH